MYKKYLSVVHEYRTSGALGHDLKRFDGAWDNSWNNHPGLLLADGSQIVFVHRSNNCSAHSFGSDDVCLTIGIDLNGSKGPNEWGRDAFVFVLKENGLYPSGCEAECVGSESGAVCACKVLREGAMNY